MTKTILKPTLAKIILTIILLVVTSILWRMYIVSRISDTFPMGFPFQFFVAWGPCQAGETCSEGNFLYLVFDVLIWYVVSGFTLSRRKS